MKKIGIIMMCLFIMVVVSGCDKSKTETNKSVEKNVLTCSGSDPGSNMMIDKSIKYTFENDKVSTADVKFIFKNFTISELSTVWSDIKEQFAEQNKPVEEVGYKRTIAVDDENYTFTVRIEIDFKKIQKETMDLYEVDDYKSKTYDEIKKEAKSLSLTCK